MAGRAWQERVAGGVLRAAVGLPGPVRRLVAGRPVSVDGQELDPELQVALRLMGLAPEAKDKTLRQRRAELDQQARIFGGTPLPVDTIKPVFIPGAAGKIAARLYRPAGYKTLLVYYHGGGFVVGGLDSTDSLCRFLAVHSDTAVLSIDYRLAPEAPFPAAVDDAVTAFHYAVSHAAELGVDPAAIGVGGDSAGGNLAAVVSQLTTAQGGTAPAFQLLFYPWLDLSTKHPSYKLFGEGFLLTEEQLDWYTAHYLRDPSESTNPRVSPLLAADLQGQPPTYIAVAGFDPLRDEGERYAERLREAGVPVTLRRHSGLIHAFASGTGVGAACRDAMLEAAAALRTLKTSDTAQ
ncbi:alpha/beta hydrolase [Kribbella antibiotica]|uniref:Alpha/beta hydrolase n=1 Tax=Kribbella antibiotica TaxID=190195 RepID=A0A4R4YN21_9ACTN|nr:alpha/beta hydrolase [Kribbella antibiotica]TDD45940.1 alpha/beta hydrolase [Kribbella antibiotica]